MSMSVEQRRTQVLERADTPAGSVRLAKASSRYDRRRRHYTVEILPRHCVGHELEELWWDVVADWPVSAGRDAPHKAYAVALKTLRALGS